MSEDEHQSEALVVAGEIVSDQIMVRRDPVTILAEATRAATALKDVIDKKAKKVIMNGEQYIESEDWVTLGRMYGLTAKLESDAFVQYGDAKGFEATMVAIDTNGVIRSRATMMCLDDEEKWGSRPKYDYRCVLLDGTIAETEPEKPFKECQLEPTGKVREDNSPVMRPKKIRVQVGVDKVPLFQLRSMAQTRALNKALSTILKFVPVLAGYRPTPAEELDGQTDTVDAQVVRTPTRNVTPARAVTPSTNGNGTHAPKAENGNAPRKISTAQVRRLWAIVHDIGLSEDAVGEAISKKYKIDSTNDVTVADYDKIIESIKDQSILA